MQKNITQLFGSSARALLMMCLMMAFFSGTLKAQYCAAPATNCSLSDVITNVTFSTLNNNSTCSAGGYGNFTALPAPQIPRQVGATLNIPMRVTVGPGGTEHVAVWIDYNQNQIFETTEFTFLGSGNGTTISGNIAVPGTATLGNTRMRVRVRWNTPLTNTGACLAYTYGETEDYTVNIVNCVTPSVTTQPANVSAFCSSNATFTTTIAGSLVTYQWQARNSSTSPWTNLTNGTTYSGVTTPSLTVANVDPTMNGRQFRVIYAGACGGTDFTDVATLTVTKLQALTQSTPSSGNMCAGGSPVNIQITNSFAGSQSLNFASTTPISIPDNVTSGVTASIPVNIPAGSIVNGIKVNLQATHTWLGDLVIALKAPNGQIINLDWYLGGTGGNGATIGMNASISSAGTVSLATAASLATITGTFAADRAAGNATFPAGPVGFTPTTGTWSNLYGTPNGNWTLAVYDGGPGDVGTITSWSIDVGFIAPASGIFSPATGLFTDAALTTPYVAGSLAPQVWAAPAQTTSYSVVVATIECGPSDPRVVNVNVSAPIAGLAVDQNPGLCVGSTKTINSSVTGGSFISYQWQVSNDNGATWVNVVNNPVFSGATTSALTITENGSPLNGLQFRVIATNACNSLTSTATTLTVNPKPVVNMSANPYTSIMPGMTTTLSAAVAPNPGASYVWYLNGNAINGSNAATYVADVDHLGTYYVEATDIKGCTSASNSITISEAPSKMLFIYPNPNAGNFQIRYYSQNGNTILPRYVNIYDSKGSRIMTAQYNIANPYQRMDVNISQYGRGVYMVELSDRNGNRITTGRVIIN